MHSGINALVSDTRICGPATTAAARAGDMLSTLKALRLAREGDVLVIDNQGDPDSAMWGEITTQEAQNRGVLALVVDGRVRDITPIRQMGFPIWARGTSPRVCGRGACGEVNVPISCGGAVVSPGDIIVADADGVVVVPQRQAPTVLRIGRDIMAYEERLLEKVASGASQVDIFALDAQFDELQEAHRARRST
jgi:regulator of RNase E activity RraA